MSRVRWGGWTRERRHAVFVQWVYGVGAYKRYVC